VQRCFVVGTLALVAPLVVGCGDGASRSSDAVTVDGTPVVVATSSILGDIVTQLAGDAAVVRVVVPNGQDPHEYSPSARDVESMFTATLVVANGLALEEGLADALHGVADDAVPVFFATDHVTLRALDTPAADAESAEDEHEHGADDPHIWTDPLVMAEMAAALSAELERVLGVQLDERLKVFQESMTEVDAQVRSILSPIDGKCVLVTGHESLGYFADRYGCRVIGAVIPSLSSSAETSARDLSDLLAVARDAGVAAIFTEVGTPAEVAEQVAGEIGVPLVELPSHLLPDDGGGQSGRYQRFIVDLASTIATALDGSPSTAASNSPASTAP
jgi:zinc/manganese transport system substrate-binding protein